MPFHLFCAKAQSLMSRVMYASKSGIFVFVGFTGNLSVLVEIHEASKHDWTKSEQTQAGDMMNLLALRIELHEAYVMHILDAEIEDSVGIYCLN